MLLFCHLVLLASKSSSSHSSNLLQSTDRSLSRDQVDNLRYVAGQVRRRLSPERARTLAEAKEAVADEYTALKQVFEEEEEEEEGGFQAEEETYEEVEDAEE